MLRDMVQSVRDNLLPGIQYEIVIVDGGSTDGSIEWAKAQSDVLLIEDGALLGAISAFTRGAKTATGKYVLLSNDDITFYDGSVIPAIVYLENNMKCGAIAFSDNRPMNQHETRADYKTSRMSAQINGRPSAVIYAQVGLFRKWLGQRLNWWQGEHDEMVGAATYAGDNSLSAQIWNYGYSVDAVAACVVEDHIANDELRQINYEKGKAHDDSQYFYRQWPQGVIVNNEPQLPQQDRRAARILYMPIYERGWEHIQKHPIHGKRGLRDALARGKNKYGANHIVQEFDYFASDPARLRSQLMELADSFKPDLILTQIQSPAPITPDILRELKQRTGASVVNWNGDQAVGGLYSPQLLPILRQIDLQLITNMEAAVVDNYVRDNIKYAYWQIGYEESQGDLEQNVADYFMELGRKNPFEGETEYPVVYLASLRSPERMAIAEVVRSFGGVVEQPSDKHATLYNFSTSALMYKRAKVIISDNGFQSRGFVSNRLFQALAAGGGVVLQQHVDGLDELTGLIGGTDDYGDNIHYVEWTTLNNLRTQITTALNDADGAARIAQRGTAFVREHFSFDAQVAKLMELIKSKLGESEQLANSIALKYVGRSVNGFGLGNSWPSGTRYEYNPGHLLYVHRDDVDLLLRYYPNEWVRMEL